MNLLLAAVAVYFHCQTNGARVVYLAGDFNEWAHNDSGRITDLSFAMSESNGVWSKTAQLEPGTYRFKFNINGEPTGWFAPDYVDERDADGNAIFRVRPDGKVIMGGARDSQWKPVRTERGVRLQFFAPLAHLVYLAGDFNDWANNRNGLVFDPQFAMKGPDSNGVWRAEIELKSGRHLYQFVIDGDRWVADPNAEETDEQNHSVLK